jgi:glycosyltransferase involved in cell wall biosynthesis
LRRVAESGRVLQVLGPSTGGIRRYVAFLTERLQDRGWHVETAGPAGVLDGVAQLDHVVPIAGGPRPLQIPGAVGALRRLGGRFDVVNAHGLTAGWLAALARGRRRQPRLVVTVHNVVLDDAAGRMAPVLRALERRLPGRADRVIAVSEAIASYLGAPNVVTVGAIGPPPTPTRTRADVRASLAVAERSLLVAAVARLHPQKGLDVLLDAVPSVPHATFAIAGEGPSEAALRQQATRLGIGDRVRFAGPMNGADLLNAADLVVIPSRWESGPLVLNEALALGRPVVSTPVGMVPEVITDGETGWLVPIGDPTALAAALADALARPDEAARRAASAAARAALLPDADARVGIVEDVYRASLVGS